jgi:predicted  nucleic acid-binding Zn-ribbon protein
MAAYFRANSVLLVSILACAGSPAAFGLKGSEGAAGGKAAERARVTPIEKVVDLLANLKAEVEKDGVSEADNYNKFACFCKDTTKTKSESILQGKDAINSLSAEIAQKTALKEQQEDALVATKQKKEELVATLAQTEADCATAKAAYEATDADLSKAISSLKGAIDTLEKSKPVGGAAAAGLLSIKETIKNSIAMADALQMVEDGPKWSAAAAFLQQTTAVDPSDPEYKFHSQGIIKVITDLLQTFTGKKNEADLEEKARVATSTETIANLNADIDLAKQKISALETEIGELATAIATARTSLVQAEATMKDDQQYLKDLTAMCEERANDYDQRSHMRGEEISTLTQALAVLKDDVATRTKVNVRALLQKQGVPVGSSTSGSTSNHTVSQSDVKVPLSFLQGTREASTRLRGSSHDASRDGAKTREQKQEERRKHALTELREAGNKLHSTTLLAIASRVSAGPFEKVKVMIEKLIERLVREATEEATKKRLLRHFACKGRD